jgi:hypothetical protein
MLKNNRALFLISYFFLIHPEYATESIPPFDEPKSEPRFCPYEAVKLKPSAQRGVYDASTSR